MMPEIEERLDANNIPEPTRTAFSKFLGVIKDLVSAMDYNSQRELWDNYHKALNDAESGEGEPQESLLT